MLQPGDDPGIISHDNPSMGCRLRGFLQVATRRRQKSPHFERLVTSLILLLQSEAAQNLPVDTWRQLGALKKYLLDTSHSGHRSVPKS